LAPLPFEAVSGGFGEGVSRRYLLAGWTSMLSAALALGAPRALAQASVAAPPQASPRAAQHISQLLTDVPPPVAVAHSISYRLARREDADSRRLDIYRNQNVGRAPVLVFFHGGAWRSGHRRQYLPLGVSLALGGITCVIPSYSKAPGYPFPEPMRDAAAAVTWVRENIQNLGGHPDRIFVGGHSSGAHLAALLALDPRYLEFHFQQPSLLRGVIAISGIFAVGKGFEYAFGSDPQYWLEASPLHYAQEMPQPGTPPFLLLTGSEDAPGILPQNQALTDALKANRIPVETETYDGEDHSSMIALASLRQSQLQQRIRDFIKARA
jgi:acetyl esterase/lipase